MKGWGALAPWVLNHGVLPVPGCGPLRACCCVRAFNQWTWRRGAAESVQFMQNEVRELAAWSGAEGTQAPPLVAASPPSPTHTPVRAPRCVVFMCAPLFQPSSHPLLPLP